ncbi:cellular tumor antigen p53-like [Xenia sp. Carnegie-2017]|uniref:cellular tumor antigen p53-like n=1 Tax=Xenia sp. Carnegie-2017 TaxID=2897299 RepID=UPI001F04A951|nr:cellular tumor antigen p53-like [Xenia sp. Carnegie-2017]
MHVKDITKMQKCYSVFGFGHVPGDYDLNVKLAESNAAISSYSNLLNCLFVKRENPCPFSISTSVAPPADTRLKINVFSEDMNPVIRCWSHSENDDFVAPLHFVRSGNNEAYYDCCSETGQLSIYLPYKHNNDLDENVEILMFLCSSMSCIKKKVFLKFSLIYRDEVVGYKTFGLHVCSTPIRDRRNHEKQRKPVRKRKAPVGAYEDTPNESKVFVLPIKQSWIYNVMKKLNRGLELLDATTVEEQAYFLKRAKRRKKKREVKSTTSSSSISRSSSKKVIVK